MEKLNIFIHLPTWLFILCLKVCLSPLVCVWRSEGSCGFSPSTLWVLGIELRSPGLASRCCYQLAQLIPSIWFVKNNLENKSCKTLNTRLGMYVVPQLRVCSPRLWEVLPGITEPRTIKNKIKKAKTLIPFDTVFSFCPRNLKLVNYSKEKKTCDRNTYL